MRTREIIQKHVGETPLQAVERFRETDQALEGIPLAYAGRLDPMASGALLVLIGDECKKQDEYNALDKTYEFEVLLGHKSDTGDVLGLAERCEHIGEYTEKEITHSADSFVGEWEMQYPVYSSKPVAGKPLFQHMYDGTIGEIEIPKAEVHIYSLEYKGKHVMSGGELLTAIKEKINALYLYPNRPNKGNDFRQHEILKRWEELQIERVERHTILRFEAHVSAGTYIRALAPAIAEQLGTCGLALSIHRSHIHMKDK